MVPNRSPRQYGQNTAKIQHFNSFFGQSMAVLDHIIIYYYYYYYYYIHYYYLCIIPPGVCHHRGGWFMWVMCLHILTIPSMASAVGAGSTWTLPQRGLVFIAGGWFMVIICGVLFGGFVFWGSQGFCTRCCSGDISRSV
jgi:hypothetical protein